MVRETVTTIVTAVRTVTVTRVAVGAAAEGAPAVATISSPYYSPSTGSDLYAAVAALMRDPMHVCIGKRKRG
jgi:hypothetical protein